MCALTTIAPTPEERNCGLCRQAIPVADWPGTVVCTTCLDYRRAENGGSCGQFSPRPEFFPGPG